MSAFIQQVPFVSGYRIVVDDIDALEGGVAVIESLFGIDERGEATWTPEQIFPCASPIEALGIASTFAATIINDVDVDKVIAGISQQRMAVPGNRYFLQIRSARDADGYVASIEERQIGGGLVTIDRRDDATSFFEAYGWALANIDSLWHRSEVADS
jgi:hypothetical protein